MFREIALAALAAASLASASAAGTPSPENAEAYIIWPPDGAVISGGKLWCAWGCATWASARKAWNGPMSAITTC